MIVSRVSSSIYRTHRAGRRLAGGFSLVELIMTIALISVLASIGIMMVASQPVAVKNTKIHSDVATLNSMVALYLADGGQLDGLTKPQAVLDRMKKVRRQQEWQKHTGMASGRLVDPRLAARLTTRPEVQGQARARWNRFSKRFEIFEGIGLGVAEFYLDEELGDLDFGTDSRRSPSVTYNTAKTGWVWDSSPKDPLVTYNSPDYGNPTGVTDPFNPNEELPADPDPGGGGGSGGGTGGGGSGGGGGGGGGTVKTKLPTPSISPRGGTFAYANFPSAITINPNGASPEGSRLEYRIGGGGWEVYDGNPLPITSGMRVDARNVATDNVLYTNSSTRRETYYRLVAGFTGTGSGTWGNATGGTNLVTSILNDAGTSTFKHGNTKLDLGNGEFLDAGVENVLSFTPEDFTDISPDTWFGLGELQLLNGTTFYNSEAESVTLSVNLNLTDPAQDGIVHLDLGLVSTDNSSDRLASADIVELRNPSTDFTIEIDGVIYRLELAWVSLDPGAGVVQGNKFLVFEGASAAAQLRARFVSDQ